MPQRIVRLALAAAISIAVGAALAANGSDDRDERHDRRACSSVQLGPRPFFLVNDMHDSSLKRRLLQCSDGPFEQGDFSIGHRGAALQFPEHTRESYQAGARMGAGILGDGNNGFYYQTFDSAISREGDLMRVIHALASGVGVLGIFSDWPAAITYYANCMGLKSRGPAAWTWSSSYRLTLFRPGEPAG